MGIIKKAILLLLLLFFEIGFLFAQKSFVGSFLMNFSISEGNQPDPFLWMIESENSGGRMAMEIQDDMIKKGVSKRVLFDPFDSTWTMMIAFNKIKQGTRIHAAQIFRDSVKNQNYRYIRSNEKRMIEGYHCKKIIIEKENYVAEIWYANELKLNTCNIYRLISHCGMIGEFVRKGNWYFSKEIKNMILEVTSRNKITGESYTMNITKIKPGDKNDSFFTTTDYKLSDIPEGFNCGVTIENH